MKCDLHVHTVHSGMCTVPVANYFCRESYSDVESVYEQLKRRGMDLITITDHDSMDAAEQLRRHDDFFASVEATCRMPSGTSVHLGIYDISQRQHMQVQQRRGDFLSLVAYLNEQDLFFSINHLFSGLTGKRDSNDFDWFERAVPAFEILNGSMPKRTNELAAALASPLRKPVIAGSDAHTLTALGRAYIDIPAARTKQEFLRGLRAGKGFARGESGSFARLTHDVLSICMSLVAEKRWLLPLVPIFAAVPVVILVNCALEAAFAERWYATVMRSKSLDALAVSDV